MTHELHLGTTDSSRNKGLALAVNDQEESEYDEKEVAMLVRRFKKFFRNNRYVNQRNNKDKRSANSKSDYECHKCGVLITSSKIAQHGKRKRARENRKTTDKRKSQRN